MYRLYGDIIELDNKTKTLYNGFIAVAKLKWTLIHHDLERRNVDKDRFL